MRSLRVCKLVDLNDIIDAAKRLAPVIVRTPLISSPVLDELTGGKILLKAASLFSTLPKITASTKTKQFTWNAEEHLL